MILVAKILAVFIVLLGVSYLVVPMVLNKMVQFAKSGKNFFVIAVVRALFGVILLFAAAKARIPWFVTLLGIIMLSSGFIPFILGLEKTHALIDWIDAKPILVKRIMAGVTIVIGGLLLYAI